MTRSRFAGVFDRRPRTDERRLRRALGDDASVRSIARRSLTLAWVDAHEPAGEPLTFLDGRVYAGTRATGGADLLRELARRFRDDEAGALRSLRGDFVLLFHDELTDTLVLARDQIGGRSLFWHERDGRLAFASEVRYLLPLLATRPEPDPVALAHWLSLSGQPANSTLFAGVHRLEEASLLRTEGRATDTRRYWEPRYQPPVDTTAATGAAELRTALREAVRRRSTGGSAPGILLSGGLDSSSVAAIAAYLDATDRPTRAYSATFPDHPSVDEDALIRIACERLGLTSTRAVVRAGSVVAGAFEYLDHWQLPPPSPNLFFWLPLLRRAAADGVTAVLDGEGGDEVFGLSPYLAADRLRHGRVRGAYDLGRRIPGGGPHVPRADLLTYFREFALKGAAPPWFHRAGRRLRPADRYSPPWLRSDLRAAFADTDVTGQWKHLDGPRWWAYLVAATTRGMGAPIGFDHLRRRATLAGLEPRHPLVDVDVIELVLRFPPELAYDTRGSRPLLRAAVQGWLPDELRLRGTKSFFDAVFHDALAGDLELTRALFDPATAQLGPYVDLALVAAHLLATPPPPGERLQWGQQLWRLVTAEGWLRAQLPGGLAGQDLPAHLPSALDLEAHA